MSRRQLDILYCLFHRSGESELYGRRKLDAMCQCLAFVLTPVLLQTFPVSTAHVMLDMEGFDSSLFDLPFEDLASLGIDAQQQQPPATIDFQDFCKDFATTDFALEPLDNQLPAWSFESATDSSEKDVGITAKSEDTSNAKSEDFLSSLDKSVFDPLEPFDSSFDDMFGSSVGNDAQVVPDIAPMEVHAPEFSMPSYTQASYVQPKPVSVTPGPSTRPYSWMNGIDYASFGWPARTRLPSESPHMLVLLCGVSWQFACF